MVDVDLMILLVTALIGLALLNFLDGLWRNK